MQRLVYSCLDPSNSSKARIGDLLRGLAVYCDSSSWHNYSLFDIMYSNPIFWTKCALHSMLADSTRIHRQTSITIHIPLLPSKMDEYPEASFWRGNTPSYSHLVSQNINEDRKLIPRDDISQYANFHVEVKTSISRRQRCPRPHIALPKLYSASISLQQIFFAFLSRTVSRYLWFGNMTDAKIRWLHGDEFGECGALVAP
jgi:hypothetical protein